MFTLPVAEEESEKETKKDNQKSRGIIRTE